MPWFVRLYEEIIHELTLVDYLLVQADKLWYNCFIPPLSVLILSTAKYGVFWSGGGVSLN